MAPAAPHHRRRQRLAGPLTGQRRATRSLWLTALLVIALHAMVLLALQQLLRPPSILKDVAPPFYTRTIAPEAPATVAAAPVAAPVESRPNRPSAQIRPARAATEKRADQKPDPAPQRAASDAEPAEPLPPQFAETPASAPVDVASAPTAEPPTAAASDAPAAPADSAVATAAQPPASAASAAEPAFLASWPSDTRLSYKLGGNYRGELHGDARVLWQREGTRYHTAVEMSAGMLASLSFTSQGDITASGLRPEVYEENVRGRRRGVRLGDDVRLNNGTRVPRPDAVQDTASQFVELGHRFATGQVQLVPGARIDFAMARPGGIDDWTYDVIGEETLHLPRLGPVPTLHLKPRPLSRPRGPISAEIWYAPSLQYLPVRIRITQGNDNYIDLMVDTIEQR